MENNKFQEKMTGITEKIGEDASNLILDDIGLLITDNQNMNETINNKDKEIENLKKRNEALQKVNANLLLQVPMEEDTTNIDLKENSKPEIFDFKSVFDEKRKFFTIILTFFEI